MPPFLMPLAVAFVLFIGVLGVAGAIKVADWLFLEERLPGGVGLYAATAMSLSGGWLVTLIMAAALVL